MWCWRIMEKISWIDLVKKCGSIAWSQGGEEHSTCNIREGKWIGHILRRDCLLKHVIEGKIEGRRRRGRKRKQLLDDLKEKEDTGT
jgi:hypothetical protein